MTPRTRPATRGSSPSTRFLSQPITLTTRSHCVDLITAPDYGAIVGWAAITIFACPGQLAHRVTGHLRTRTRNQDWARWSASAAIAARRSARPRGRRPGMSPDGARTRAATCASSAARSIMLLLDSVRALQSHQYHSVAPLTPAAPTRAESSHACTTCAALAATRDYPAVDLPSSIGGNHGGSRERRRHGYIQTRKPDERIHSTFSIRKPLFRDDRHCSVPSSSIRPVRLHR